MCSHGVKNCCLYLYRHCICQFGSATLAADMMGDAIDDAFSDDDEEADAAVNQVRCIGPF